MNITNPNAFWLLFLLLIPILIHLFQFRKYKKLKFSNVAFLKAAHQEQKNTRKLKHLLILLSRLLFIIFFILCIAKPFWSGDNVPSEVSLIVLDRSSSNMSYVEGRSNTVLEENMNLINRLQEQFAENVQIVDESGNSLEVYENLGLNAGSTQLPLDKLLGNQQNVESVLILSDFQKQVIDENKSIFADSSRQFIFMPPYQVAPSNLVWDSVWVASATATAFEEPLVLRVRSTGALDATNISFQLNNNLMGTRQIESTNELNDTLGFSLRADENQKSQRLTFNSDDALVNYDNVFYFTRISSGKIKVILLQETQNDATIRAIFEKNDLFEFTAENINNYSFRNLNDYDVAIVKMGGNFNSFKADALKAYSDMGKTLVLVPQEDFKNNQLLSEFGLNNSRRYDISSDMIQLQNPDPKNPFYKNIFKSIDRNMEMPTAQLFLNWQSGQSLLSYINGNPFLSRTGNAQNIYTFSAPFEIKYSNFIRHGLFLPIFYKIAFSGKVENAINYHFLDQDLISFTQDGIPSGIVLKLQRDNQQIVTDQRIQGNKISLILPPQEIAAGFYELRDAKSDSIYSYLAFNYPKIESQNSFYTASELKELFSDSPHITVLDDYDVSTLGDYLLESKTGFPLWKYFLILALLSLLAEVLIIRLFK
jgi:hypothetical protein